MSLERMLAAGYFPAELPPPFTTELLGAETQAVSAEWDILKPIKTEGERYSFPRHARARRNLTIVNPISHYYLSQCIVENWAEISNHLKQDAGSYSVPSFSPAGSNARALVSLSFQDFIDERNSLMARYARLVVSDIERYYPSIYTHSIAWALHGKDWCKAHLHQPVMKSSLGDKLDKLVRSSQSDQSIGIPLGPDTSKVIGELVLTSVIKPFASAIPNGATGIRYVDDICVGLPEGAHADEVVSEWVKALAVFALRSNEDKTRVIADADVYEANWVSELRQHVISQHHISQKYQLENFFSDAIKLSKQYALDNVIDWGIKRLRSFPIVPANFKYVQEMLAILTRANPISLRSCVQILTAYVDEGLSIDVTLWSSVVNDLLVRFIRAGYHGETAWTLFLAREIGVKVGGKALDLLAQMTEASCVLVVLDLREQGLVDGSVDPSRWEKIVANVNLDAPEWLLVYESVKKGWLGGGAASAVQGHPHFSTLWSADVEFYDPARRMASAQVGIGQPYP